MNNVREEKSFHERIKDMVKLIPEGKVATYGQIAELAGNPRASRQVAWVLKRSGEELPWHRVINSKGFISLPEHAGFYHQKNLLQHEGVEVSDSGKIDLRIYRWHS